jgi:hypothetical protein
MRMMKTNALRSEVNERLEKSDFVWGLLPQDAPQSWWNSTPCQLKVWDQVRAMEASRASFTAFREPGA